MTSLLVDHHSDIELLAKAISCHRTFVKKVLLAIKSEDLESLYERKMKNTAIKATHWPQEISKFVQVRWIQGQYQEKIKSLCDMEYVSQNIFCCILGNSLLKNLKSYTPNVNIQSPQSQENFRRMQSLQQWFNKKLMSQSRKCTKSCKDKCLSKIKCDDDHLPVSCRDLVYKTIGQTELVVSSNPLTWSSACVAGECDSCKKKLIWIKIPRKFKDSEVFWD